MISQDLKEKESQNFVSQESLVTHHGLFSDILATAHRVNSDKQCGQKNNNALTIKA